MTLNGTVLKLIVPNLEIKRAEELSKLIIQTAVKYKMYNADVLHEFISQCAHESIGFRAKAENLNYSEEALLRVFHKYFDAISAKEYARKPEKIANIAYANRMGNGNQQSGDGWRYRGAGFIQLTGKDITREYDRYCGGNNPEQRANLCRTNDADAMDSAGWVFAVNKGLIQLAIDDNFLLITKRINGGYNGLADRQAYYERAKKYLKP
jgi:putative chitinase